MFDLLILYYKELYQEVSYQFLALFQYTNRLNNFKWLAFAFVAGFIIYAIRLRSFHRVFKRSFRFIKTKRVRLEFLKDIKFFFFKALYKPFVIVFFGFNVHSLRDFMQSTMSSLDLNIPVYFHMDTSLGPFFKLLMAALVYDFAFYILHYIQHKYEPAWFFHKLHHKATSLNPFTKLRIHPVLYFANFAGMALIGTPILYLILSFYDIPDTQPLYFYAMLYLIIENAFTHLRHTHVRIHFGPLSYLLMSPVMHQVHHSLHEKHYNKNIGALFTLWDLMFGTFYIPQKNEFFKIGLKESRNQVTSMKEDLTEPFSDLYKYCRPKKNKKCHSKALSPIVKSGAKMNTPLISEIKIATKN